MLASAPGPGTAVEFEEEGYRRTSGRSFGECAGQCGRDIACTAFEFYRPRNQCVLFSFNPTAVRGSGRNDIEAGYIQR